MKMLQPLLQQLFDFGFVKTQIIVYDNGYINALDKQYLCDHVTAIDAEGWRFYSMWNHAWKRAFTDGFETVAILNDDIALNEDSLVEACRVLHSQDDIGLVGLNYRRALGDKDFDENDFTEKYGTYKSGGIWACAFVMKSSTWGRVPAIDENYWLWYGDDELIENMRIHGYRCGIANNAAVKHEGSVTTNMFPDLLKKTLMDKELFLSKFS